MVYICKQGNCLEYKRNIDYHHKAELNIVFLLLGRPKYKIPPENEDPLWCEIGYLIISHWLQYGR